jgi:nucleoside 2-deoxyribosyltransferase
MNENKLQCFIALRIGAEDTDLIYDKMAGTIEDLGLTPRLINRIHHIENINSKIISEIEKADIAIADLTYARPSVYFEAGYAQRKIPVIYTCREDHLHNKEDNLKMHFDVDRNNVIFWNNSNDISFQSTLKSRLQFVISELVNVPLLNTLNEYLIYLNRSRLNPDHIFGRIKKLYSILASFPRNLPTTLNHERNIHERMKIYCSISEIIRDDFPVEANTVVANNNHWTEFLDLLSNEIAYLEKLYDESNYGNKVMYASHLCSLYKIYLEAVTKVYQRPSNTYGEIYNRVKSSISRFISDIEKPTWK